MKAPHGRAASGATQAGRQADRRNPQVALALTRLGGKLTTREVKGSLSCVLRRSSRPAKATSQRSKPTAGGMESAISRFAHKETASDRPALGSPRVVISGTRALQSAKNFAMLIESLVDELDAAIRVSCAARRCRQHPNDRQIGPVAGMKDSKSSSLSIRMKQRRSFKLRILAVSATSSRFCRR